MRFSLSDALSSYRGIVFDLDGTLLSLPVDWTGLRHDLHCYWQRLGLDAVDLGVREGLNTVELRCGRPALERSFGIIRAHERAAVSQATCHYDVIEAAFSCAERGQSLGLLSANMTETAEESLVLIDLSQSFQVVVGGDEVRRRKPDPEGLRKIMEKFRLEPSEIAYVADGDHEAAMARQLGIDIFRSDHLALMAA